MYVHAKKFIGYVFFFFFSSPTNAHRHKLLYGQSEHLRLAHGFTQLSAEFHLHAELRLGFWRRTVYSVELYRLLDSRLVSFHVGYYHSQQVSLSTLSLRIKCKLLKAMTVLHDSKSQQYLEWMLHIIMP